MKKFFTQMMGHWNRLPRVVMSGGIQGRVGWDPGHLDSMASNPVHAGELELDDLQGIPSLSHFMNLWLYVLWELSRTFGLRPKNIFIREV